MQDDDHAVEDSSAAPDFAVVGIGASAGGIQALIRLFSSAPIPSDAAFVVVLHLSPDHTSHAQEVLQKATRLKVLQVNQLVALERDHVYVIPPGKHISMVDGHLRLMDPEVPRLPPTSIDVFFRSLADAHGSRSIAILLSGTGSDGSLGIGRIRERGGFSVAQSPEEAEYREMPRNAIETGNIDLILPLSEILPKVAELITNARTITLPAADEPDPSPPVAEAPNRQGVVDSILDILRQRTLHDFALYKRGTVLRRIERRMQVTGSGTIEDYSAYFSNHVDETAGLVADLLVGVTNFFRDPRAFDALQASLAASVLKRAEATGEIRAWVPACATGEEAFSIAILLDEIAERAPNRPRVTVYASDIDERAIALARTGNYPQAIENDISPARLAHYFIKGGDRYQVSKPLRDTVVFAAHNLLRDPPFSRLDLISCRNLLIYLERTAQNQILNGFHFSLQPEGILFLGAAESADLLNDHFVPLDKHAKVYRTGYQSGPAQAPVAANSVYTSSTRGQSFFSYAFGFSQRAIKPTIPTQELDLFGPPNMMMTVTGDIEHCSANAMVLINSVREEGASNLFDVVREDEHARLRACIAQSIATGRREELSAVPFVQAHGESIVDLSLQPYSSPARGQQMLFVTCDVVFTSAGGLGRPVSHEGASNVESLQRALAGSEDRLRSSLQFAQSSTEELKASNEELQAMNEELRSASEELEASREELQSLNEELITVNAELLAKVQESGRISDDLQNLISLVGVATVFVDRSLNIKRFTAPAETLFNILPGDRGRPLQHLTHRLEYPDMIDDLKAAFESLKKAEREVSSGDGRRFLARVLPYRTDDDRIDGAVLALIDITEQRIAQDVARASEEKLRLAAQSTRDFAIIVTDNDGIIADWNLGATQIFGYAAEEAIGKSIDLIFSAKDLEDGASRRERVQATTYGRAEDERWHVHKSGKEIFCSGFMSRIQATGFLGFAKIVRNETSRKLDDERRASISAQERADLNAEQDRNRLKDEFLAVLSHELKNPLNLISMKAEMLSRIPELRHVGRAQEIAGAISHSVSVQGQLIDDLLDLSRLNTGKLSLRLTPVDLVSIVNLIMETIEADMATAGIRLKLDLATEPILIAGDAVRIEQIVWNLMTNALKFTPKGGVVTTQLRLDDGHAQLDVIDTGIGIAADSLDSVFEIFAQAGHYGPRGRAGGLGIGLSLVKQLTELHGGEVTVRSAGLGYGAQFTVRFPVDSSLVVRGASEQPANLALLDRMRILLVEDSSDSLGAMVELLSLYGAAVTPAANGAQALQAAQELAFDVVITDVNLPDMPPYALVAELRKLASLSNTPIIAVTGRPIATEAVVARAAGCDACLPKPFSLQSICQEIARLQGRSGEEPADAPSDI